MPIRFDRYVFDENAQCISVYARPKRIEMYAFSNENALMSTGPQSRELEKWFLPREHGDYFAFPWKRFQ